MPYAVEMRGITTYFSSSGVLANKNVDLRIERAEIHAVIGENGAGKTTLMNSLYGLRVPDSGDILIGGKVERIPNTDAAIRLGIGMVHQHFKLVPSFTVTENICLGLEVSRMGLLSASREIDSVRKLMEEYGLPVDPKTPVRELPVGMRQRVEILKALMRRAKILLLDEPTAVLTPQEASSLFDVLRRLAAHGCSVVLITHKLPEVLAVADTVTVMRRGEVVGRRAVAGATIPELAKMMVGRDVLFTVKRERARPGDVELCVKDLVVAGSGGLPAVRGVSLDVRKGEIVGIAGVNGNGQSELVEAITGLRTVELGSVELGGNDISAASVRARRDRGTAHIPEDRMVTGLDLQASLAENVIVSSYKRPAFSRFGVQKRRAVRDYATGIIKEYAVASASPDEGVATLSGGNMQKIVLGRELYGNPRFILANQPTRGLDVGSIEFVHKSIVAARDRGAAVLLVSVELDEIRALCDRILVMYGGKIVGMLSEEEATDEKLGILMLGGRL
jgi:general nucleoside transport system ATP-binding protein